MTARKPAEDVTRDWQATQDQKSSAGSLRLFALLCWIVAIGGEIAGIYLLFQHKFDHGNMPLLIGLLVGIAIFAIAGNLLWKAANRHDPARESDTARFFFQNQLGAIITLIAFLPLLVLILNDKDMDPQTKKIAGGIGAVLAVLATLTGISYHPPSVEQYTQDMNACATQIKTGQPTTACSPDVAAQAQAIAADLLHGDRGDERHGTPRRSGCRLLDRAGGRRQEVRDAACLPPLRGCQSAQRQDRTQRLRDGGLRTERCPHHEADPDGTEAVRVHGFAVKPPAFYRAQPSRVEQRKAPRNDGFGALDVLMISMCARPYAELVHRVVGATGFQGGVASEIFLVVVADVGAGHVLMPDAGDTLTNFRTLNVLHVSKHRLLAEIFLGEIVGRQSRRVIGRQRDQMMEDASALG